MRLANASCCWLRAERRGSARTRPSPSVLLLLLASAPLVVWLTLKLRGTATQGCCAAALVVALVVCMVLTAAAVRIVSGMCVK